MPELRKLDCFFLRYVPHATMDDYVTFGVLMFEHTLNGFADVRFAKNWERRLCTYPGADLDYFPFLKQDIRERLSNPLTAREFLARMEESFSGSIQASPYKPYLAEDPRSALETLVQMTLDLPLAPAKAKAKGKHRILRKIQDAFQQAGIWRMRLKNMPAAKYTYSGDPLKIDIAYRANSVIKMLQALSVETNIDSAKALAFSYPYLAAGIARKENAKTLLMAVVDDDLPRTDPEVNFALARWSKAGLQSPSPRNCRLSRKRPDRS